ncbi:hypothetical protein KM043_016449 [Ampulex compressa]|nr:hypothetical protein KM043_016449 [Ampulex compressa]
MQALIIRPNIHVKARKDTGGAKCDRLISKFHSRPVLFYSLRVNKRSPRTPRGNKERPFRFLINPTNKCARRNYAKNVRASDAIGPRLPRNRR